MALTKIQAAGLTADLIDETKLADNSIDSEHYNDGSIDNAHLADDAVGVDELSATGTASSSTFLRGDNTWATPTDTNTTYSVGDGGLTTNDFTDADHTKLDGIAASANNYVHPNHTGDVTSTADGAKVIADDVVDEANLKVDNSPTNDYVLTAKSSAAGGLTWAEASGGAALTGSTNNTVVTVTGANAIAGESTFTYNGSDTLKVAPAGASPAVFIGESDRTTADQQLAEYTGHWDGTNVARMVFHVGADTTNKDEGRITFQTAAPGGTLTERLRIDETGSVKVTDGDLVIGTAGHGIDFSQTSDNAGATGETFKDYEEGIWTPGVYHQGASNNTGFYTKIGRMVYAHFRLTADAAAGNTNHQRIVSLPFTIKDSNPCGSCARGYQTYNLTGGPLYSLSSNSTEVYLYTNTGSAISAADLGTTTLTGTFIYMTDS